MASENRHPPQDAFEKWRDRILSVAVPIFLAVLAYRDIAADDELQSTWVIVLLAAYGSGLGAYAVKQLLGKVNGGGSDSSGGSEGGS